MRRIKRTTKGFAPINPPFAAISAISLPIWPIKEATEEEGVDGRDFPNRCPASTLKEE